MADYGTLAEGIFSTGFGIWGLVYFAILFRKEPTRNLPMVIGRIFLFVFYLLFLNQGLNSLSLYFRGTGWMDRSWFRGVQEIVAGVFFVLTVIHLVLESSLTRRRRLDRKAEEARGSREVKRVHGAKPPASVNPPAKQEEAAG